MISIDDALSLIQKGDVVAIPTETVYGLAASYTNLDGVERIFQLKNRPSDNPLILHGADLSDFYPLIAHLPPDFEKLAAAFWPGPLTLIVDSCLDKIPAIVRGNLPTIALRIPNHPQTLALLKKTGPLVAPSANISGRPSATHPDHIKVDFGTDFPILEGEFPQNGVESTILMIDQGKWSLVRLGAIEGDRFLPYLGYIPSYKAGSIHSPGQRYRHYAPQKRLELASQKDPAPEAVMIGYDDRDYPYPLAISLGNSQNPKQIASHLYKALRHLDQLEGLYGWIDDRLPSEGLYATLAERIWKASQKKD